MSFVITAPETVALAASDLASIGTTLSATNVMAARPTTGVLAAAADDVSTAIAALFGAHGQAYQAIGAQATADHTQFVQALTGAAAAPAATAVLAAVAGCSAVTGAPAAWRAPAEPRPPEGRAARRVTVATGPLAGPAEWARRVRRAA